MVLIKKEVIANRPKLLCKFVEPLCANDATIFFSKYYMVCLENRMTSQKIAKNQNRLFKKIEIYYFCAIYSHFLGIFGKNNCF